MRTRHWIATAHWPAITLAISMAVSHASPATAAESNPAHVPTSFVGPPRAPRALVAAPLTPAVADELALGRAAYLWQNGDLRGAAALLESIDITTASSFAHADRAAFLLAASYLALKDIPAFERTAARASSATGSPYRRWIHYTAQIKARGASPGIFEPAREFPGAAILAAGILIDANQPQAALRVLEATPPQGTLASVHLYLRARARVASGTDPSRDWESLAAITPASELESDLVAIALLELATERLARGAAAAELLARVPPGSRHAARARHIAGMQAVAERDTARARDVLTAALDADPYYDGRRDAKFALGTVAMERRHWRAALRYFESADDNWRDEMEALARIESNDSSAWIEWERQSAWRAEIRLAPEAVVAAVFDLAAMSLDLRGTPVLAPDPELDRALWPAWRASEERNTLELAGVLGRHAPDAGEWDALRSLRAARVDADAALASNQRAALDWRLQLEQKKRYLALGAARAGASAHALSEASSRLDSLAARLDAVLAELEAVRDTALAHVATRTRRMNESLQRDVLFMHALRHFHVDGPNRDRVEMFPPGIPSPGTLLVREDSLAGSAAALLSLCAERYPGLIHRSFAEVWRPRLLDDTRALRESYAAEVARARRVDAAIDASIAALANDGVLTALLANNTRLTAVCDSLAGEERSLQAGIVRAVAARGRAALEHEREALDYGVADATYEIAVEAATDTATAEKLDVVVPLRDRAIAALEGFLADHPASHARAETRFRLADLSLMRARDDFQSRMAGFLDEKPTADAVDNRSLAPFVDYAPAIALYETILSEDPGFPHIDAVLFHLGMILSDDGQPRGSEYLARLVREYPDSPDVQEAWLRMGGDRFDREDYAGAAPLFEKAVAGSDPSFSAHALYKLGWSHFEEDGFVDAADAFRRLMDLYAAHPDIATSMDLRDEAEEYLVHSLARAGGASAFRDYFDRVGQRDYESRVLLALGHLTRGVSLYEEAIACDELWLERYPDDPASLAVTEGLIDTYRRWNKPDAAREVKLAQAARFLPGTTWYQANDDAALRNAGGAFAQSAYRENAAFHHQKARATNDAASWRAALTSYQHYLTNWPDNADAKRIHFMAGEAAGRLADYRGARAHFATAAASDSTALAADAAWHGIAVTDAWYRATRPAETASGADSIATLLIRDSRAFTTRFPADTRGADVMWRQGNVAYVHRGYADAAVTFAAFGERYPQDARAVVALRMSGDARFRLDEFEAAGISYERALGLARGSAPDSVVTALERAIPVCYFKHAEGIAAADTSRGPAVAAPVFARVAREWPRFEHADLALYRAGLGYAKGGKHNEAITAWETLHAQYPKSEYARDAAAQVALAHEKAGNAPDAAVAYERFSRLYPGDPDAPGALLKAGDLFASGGKDADAERMHTLFLERFPGEKEAVMEIRAERARRELARVSAGGSTLSALLPARPGAATGASDLQAYLKLAGENPALASTPILAQVEFLKAEELYPAYAAITLTQPLPASLERKKTTMEALVAAYERCTQYNVAEFSRASAHRIGRVLVDFGDALMNSERPEGLSEEDRLGYDDVIGEQSFAFYDRGEAVWSKLLREADTAPDDPGQWIARTREALWPRLAERFLYRPEVNYPLVAATPPPPPKTE